MKEPVDRTVVQDSGKTVVAGNPGMDGNEAVSPGQGEVKTAQEGMVLKQRFELVELLGTGGMGAVFKARDLRQVEAGDADPWVAVKVINESFARHEHALVSLQQETKKTQRLSHPNIVSAYDFDRDGPIAYMTMELLQGQSLDQLLRQNKTGLSESRATHILRQVTDAIAYAHQQGIVHADLKPANIFITSTGLVKVLDFGIARAIYGQSSVLDSATVQAFTPAYASTAVLCGAMPKPQDDLYALGCIFYMLFTGQHPYRKCKATEADAAAMKPTRIAELSRSQWQAIKLLLAFHPRQDLSVENFRTRYFGDQSKQSRRLALASLGLLMVVVSGILVFNWFTHREHRSVIALLSVQSLVSVEKGVQRLNTFDEADSVLILESARDAILSNLQQRMQQLSSAEHYQQTQRQFQLVMPLYTDSSAIQDLWDRFRHQRELYVTQAADELSLRIDQRRYADTEPDFSTLLNGLKAVAPDHPLLTRFEFRDLLAREAGLAIYLGHRAMAESIVEQASILYPQDATSFQKILSRANQAGAVVEGKGRVSLSGNLSEQWLGDYQRAVQSAGRRDLTDTEELVHFMAELQQENPAMYAVLAESLQAFLAGNQLSDPESLALKKSLLPATKPKLAARRDPCRSSSANRGADARYRCRDSLTRAVKGPELVVIKGSRNVASFAVSRTEVTISDYNHYCRLYKSCSVQAGGDKPLTDISYKQAKRYASWLSTMSGYRYSLPSLSQWRLMARDDSGVSDHNCKVYAGGRWIRGETLRPAAEGYQNSQGLLNLFGNAAEWVGSGTDVYAVGGDARTDLINCVPDTIKSVPPEGGPLIGFRVVRALKRHEQRAY